MITNKQIVFALCIGCVLLATVHAAPDSGEHVPTPGPGLVYGGIPYGSVSGNVAEFFKRQAPPNVYGGHHAALSSGGAALDVQFAPIEQYL